MASEYGRLSKQTQAWVQSVLGPSAHLRAATALSGGLTAAMDQLTIATGRREFDVVLRRWADHEWGPGLVNREAAGLSALAGHDLPVPRLLAADPSGTAAGEPSVLMSVCGFRRGVTRWVQEILGGFGTWLTCDCPMRTVGGRVL